MRALVLSLLLLPLTGCGPSGPPDCSARDVRNVVLDVVKDEFARQRYAASGQILVEGVTLEAIVEQSDRVDLITAAQKALNEADRAEFHLSGFRTNSVNETRRMTSCAATLSLNANEIEITYDAQYSDDGMVYVEVFGL